MNQEDLNLKAKTKLESLKNERAGKMQQINVSVSENQAVNFQAFYEEIMMLASMHKVQPDDLYIMGSHLHLISTNAKIMAQSGAKQLSREEKQELLKQKEIEEGKVRVGPEEEIKTEE